MNVLAADTLLDARMPGPVGAEIVTVPAVAVGELLLYPRPVIQHGDGIEPVALVLDLRHWLISLPGGLSVPVECTSAQAAVDTADAFRADAERGAISSYSPGELAKWAAWWCAQRDDAIELNLGGASR